MRRLGKLLKAGSALVGAVLVVNIVEFALLPGQFPGVGMIGVFALAVVGVLAMLVAAVMYPFSRFSRTTSKALVTVGLLLVSGAVPLYFMFGCVFYRCPG